jgi:hypothetical protein
MDLVKIATFELVRICDRCQDFEETEGKEKAKIELPGAALSFILL